MTIDVLRVRTDRVSEDERHEESASDGDATIDLSEVPARYVETYVERTVDEGYEECYLERRGTNATLTAVREPPTTESPVTEAPRAEPPETTESSVSNEPDSRPANRPNRKWGYAVFATERTPQ